MVGRSRNVRIPAAAAHTGAIACTACMAVPRQPWSVSSSPRVAIRLSRTIDGEPSTVTFHPRPRGQSGDSSSARRVMCSDFSGTVVTAYVVSDGTTSATGTLTITVAGTNSAPTEPVISPAVLTPNALTGVITGSASSTDGEGDTLIWSGSTTTKGTVEVSQSGMFTYTPRQEAREGRLGALTDTFTISVGDGVTTVTKSVTVTIAAVNVQLAQTTVGDRPNGIALTPDGTRAYIANQGVNTVSVVDTATNAVVATVAVASPPTAVVVSPDGTRAYVTSQTGTVSVINTATNTAINVGGATRGIAVSPDGSRVYATMPNLGQVVAIDTATRSIVATFGGVGLIPNRIVVAPDGGRAYVTNNASASVAVLDLVTNTVVTSIAVATIPNVLAISPDGSRVYVTSADTNAVTIIDTAGDTVINTINVGSPSRGAAINFAGTLLYVTAGPTSSVGTVSVFAIGDLGANPTST